MTQHQSKQFVLKRIDKAVQDYVRKLLHFAKYHSAAFEVALDGLDRHFPG